MTNFGKLYSQDGNPRTIAIKAVAKANNVDLEYVETIPTDGVSAEYLKINKLGKIPTFVGADGYTLHECVAIAIYITSQNEKTTLLGKTKQDYATILKWMSFFNTEVLPPIAGWFRPLTGRDPYNKKSVDDSQKAALKAIKVVEEHLQNNTYLAGERLTLADLFSASLLSRGFQFVFDQPWRTAYPNVTRWYETVYNQPVYSAVVDKLAYIEKAVVYTPPKKEKAPAAPKAAPKPKAKEVDDEDDEPAAEAPKSKHPLEALDKPAMVLDEWKRQYSNNETDISLKWFWENMDLAKDYSIWKVDYKYNEELTVTFMSSNLASGFFTRLEGSRKYLFGCLSVYGENNDSVIQGAMLVRGQEIIPAVEVGPDYESFDFKKLDPAAEADKQFVNDQWTWEKPVVVGGKTYEWKDGKVFK